MIYTIGLSENIATFSRRIDFFPGWCKRGDQFSLIWLMLLQLSTQSSLIYMFWVFDSLEYIISEFQKLILLSWKGICINLQILSSSHSGTNCLKRKKLICFIYKIIFPKNAIHLHIQTLKSVLWNYLPLSPTCLLPWLM